MRYLVVILFLIGIVLGVSFVVSMTKNTAKPMSMSSNKAQTHAAPNTIIIKDYSFSPARLTIKKGTTITWMNQDIARHTVTIDDGKDGPSSQFFGQNEKYSYTFNTTGTFAYHCEPHPYMKGKVIVTE